MVFDIVAPAYTVLYRVTCELKLKTQGSQYPYHLLPSIHLVIQDRLFSLPLPKLSLLPSPSLLRSQFRSLFTLLPFPLFSLPLPSPSSSLFPSRRLVLSFPLLNSLSLRSERRRVCLSSSREQLLR